LFTVYIHVVSRYDCLKLIFEKTMMIDDAPTTAGIL